MADKALSFFPPFFDGKEKIHKYFFASKIPPADNSKFFGTGMSNICTGKNCL